MTLKTMSIFGICARKLAFMDYTGDHRREPFAFDQMKQYTALNRKRRAAGAVPVPFLQLFNVSLVLRIKMAILHKHESSMIEENYRWHD